jgi:hypothetical protein
VTLRRSETLQDWNEFSLNIYNVTGIRVTNLVRKNLSSGEYCWFWDGSNSRGGKLTSGIYLAQIEWGSVRAKKKVVLLN